MEGRMAQWQKDVVSDDDSGDELRDCPSEDFILAHLLESIIHYPGIPENTRLLTPQMMN